MMIFRRILPLITPLLFLGILFFITKQFAYWPWGLGLLALVMVSSVKYILAMPWHRAAVWLYILPLLVFLIGGVGLYFFLSSVAWQIFWATFSSLLLGIYLEIIFVFHYQPLRYVQLSLPHTTLILHTVGTFAMFAFFFALYLIRVLPLPAIVVVAFVYAAAASGQFLWCHKIWAREHFSMIIAIGAVVAELVWVLHFWPTAFYVNGVIMAVAMYCLPSLWQLHIRGSLTAAALWRHGIVAGVAVLSVVGTAQWS